LINFRKSGIKIQMMNNKKININKHNLIQDIREIKSVSVDQNYHIKIVVINNFRKPKVNFIEGIN
jgi:hypothetical protein